MADATRWVTAAEGLLRWPAGSFLAAYRGNIARSRALTLDASPLAAPISMLLRATDRWSGTATDLLRALEERVDAAATRRCDWPKTAAVLGTALRRLAPDLRKVDHIDVQFPQHHGSGRIISLVRVRESLSQVSHDDGGRGQRGQRFAVQHCAIGG